MPVTPEETKRILEFIKVGLEEKDRVLSALKKRSEHNANSLQT